MQEEEITPQQDVGQSDVINQEETNVVPEGGIRPVGEVVQEGQAQEKTQEAPQQGNFRELREAKEKAEKERDEAVHSLSVVYEQRFQQQQQYQEPQYADPNYAPAQEDYNINIADDDLAEGKHIHKMNKRIEELEDKLYQNQQHNNEVATVNALRGKYPDFESVVTDANLKKLRRDYPEIADSLYSSPDLYKKSVSAYTLIKKFNIDKGDPYMANKNKAQKNSAKPRPLASVAPQEGNTPLSRANAFAEGLTEDLKAKLRKEMEEIRKNN